MSHMKLKGALGALALVAGFSLATQAEGPSVSGFIDSAYNYNLNGERTNTLRSFDNNSNSFELQNAEVVVAGKSGKDVSYRLDLNFGEDATNTNYANSNAGLSYDVQQAFISVPCPLTGGLFTVGKFVTPFGAEVIEAKDNFNTSRGHLFNYAIPLYHMGFKYDKSFGDLSLTGGVVNGWDNNSENNNGKTVLFQAAKPLGSKLKVILGGAYGPEQNDTVRDTNPASPTFLQMIPVNVNGKARSLVDAVVTFNPLDKLALVANYDWGVEEGLTPAGTDTAQNWSGIALMGKYAFTDLLSGALRYENFDDEGSRTSSTAATADDQGQVLHSLTATLECKKNDVITRFEIRQDTSSQKVYTDSDGAASDKQTTVGLQWIYAF